MHVNADDWLELADGAATPDRSGMCLEWGGLMAALQKRDLEPLIGELYEAALHPQHWAEWFVTAAAKFNCNSGLFFVQDPRHGAVDILGTHNFSSKALQLYADYYHQCDLWAQRSSRMLMKATRSEDLCSEQEFANSEIYTDLGRPYGSGAFFMVGAVLPMAESVAVIGFHNTRSQGAFELAHAQALERLLPHLQRALLLRDSLKQADQRAAHAEAALDALDHGILTVKRDATVLHANAVAQRILQQADGVAVAREGTLVASRAGDAAALRRLIAGCTSPIGGGAMSLPRPSGLRPLEVVVLPLPTTSPLSRSRAASALVLLRDPESKVTPLPHVLSSLYRLTPAEGRLAGDLLRHLTLEEIAQQRGVSRETLRTQLKELFRKTDTRRQSELIGFLSAGLATVLRTPHRASDGR